LFVFVFDFDLCKRWFFFSGGWDRKLALHGKTNQIESKRCVHTIKKRQRTKWRDKTGKRRGKKIEQTRQENLFTYVCTHTDDGVVAASESVAHNAAPLRTRECGQWHARAQLQRGCIV
jgi:hypothetical protein